MTEVMQQVEQKEEKVKKQDLYTEGSLTVFYAGIFSALILFLVALLNLGRMLVMQNGVRSDLDLASAGIMAEYQKEWADDYGLYMIPESRLKGGIIYFLTENGVHPYGNILYTDVEAEAEDSLMNMDSLEMQISGFMRERGVLALMDEVLEMLSEARETELTSPKEDFYAGTADLLEIQATYASLVTVMDGIRNDGTYEEYYVNGLWEDPSRESVQAVLDKMVTLAEYMYADPLSASEPAAGVEKNTEEDGGPEPLTREDRKVLSEAKNWLEEVEDLCEEGSGLADELAVMRNKLAADPEKEAAAELLPYTEEDMTKNAEKLRKNKELCGKAVLAMDDILLLADLMPSLEEVQAAIDEFTVIDDFDGEIDLPYEYRSAPGNINFSDLLHQIQGYPDHLSEYAPDEDKDVFPEGIPESFSEDEGTLADLNFGQGFENTFLTTEYCVGIFRNFQETIAEKDDKEKPINLRGQQKKDRFFQNEAEYLITGKYNEYENVNGARRRMIAIRTVLNLAYLLTNTEKREEIQALASSTGGILLPGVGDVVAFAAIAAAWSGAESIVDYRCLTEGKTVPLVKDDQTWKTDLGSVTELALDDIESDDESDRGWDYAEYLRILFYLMDRETRLERIQMLLYLNHSEFPLTEAVTAFHVSGTAKGQVDLNFESSYGYYSKEK